MKLAWISAIPSSQQLVLFKSAGEIKEQLQAPCGFQQDPHLVQKYGPPNVLNFKKLQDLVEIERQTGCFHKFKSNFNKFKGQWLDLNNKL